MGTGSSSDAKGLTHITDVTKVEKELVVFDWTILDFESTNLNCLAKSSTFKAGERFGRPSQWYLGLKYCPDKCGYINVGLYLESAVPIIDRPNDITSRVDLSLLDPEGKPTREFGYKTKTFSVPFFGGPQSYLDYFEWTHVIDLNLLEKNKNNILSATNSTVESVNLHLRLKMEIQGKSVSSVAIRGPIWMAENLQEEYAHTRDQWLNKENTDCIIKCQNMSINAHMNILSSRSRIFAAMLKPEFQAQTKQSDKTNGNLVVLPVDNIVDPSVLEAMLRYIYIGNLEGIPWNLGICSGLVKAADQFELFALRNSCFVKLIFGMNVSNAGHIAVFAHNNRASNEIKCQISDFIRLNWTQLENMDEFYKVVREQPLAFAFFHLPPLPTTATTEDESFLNSDEISNS